MSNYNYDTVLASEHEKRAFLLAARELGATICSEQNYFNGCRLTARVTPGQADRLNKLMQAFSA